MKDDDDDGAIPRRDGTLSRRIVLDFFLFFFASSRTFASDFVSTSVPTGSPVFPVSPIVASRLREQRLQAHVSPSFSLAWKRALVSIAGGGGAPFIIKSHTPLFPRGIMRAAIVHNACTPSEWLLWLVEGSMRWPLLLLARGYYFATTITRTRRARHGAARRDGGRYKNNC